MRYDYLWDNRLDSKRNVINVINDYIPYSLNFFSPKRHAKEATTLLDQVTKSTTLAEIYLTLQAKRQTLIDDGDEFKPRLDYLVNKLEFENPGLKVAGTIGQAGKGLASTVLDYITSWGSPG
jgi:hypothetical protein